MNEQIEIDPESIASKSADGVSRRGMLLGIGAAAGAVAGAGLVSTETHAASAVPRISTSLRPEAVDAPTAGLTYVSYDAFQWVAAPDQPGGAYYGPTSGLGLVTPPGYVYCSINLPVGSKINRIDVGYQKQPIVQILRRPLTITPQGDPSANPAPISPVVNLPVSPGGQFSATVQFTTPVEIEAGYSYLLGAFLGSNGGNTIYNAVIGYTPPPSNQQSFFPFAGATPRVLDTRDPGPLTGKLAANEERVVDLGITGARTAVINLTVTQTGGAGFVAAFQNGITWPGNSSINWYEPNSDLANGVVVALDSTGKIKIRGGGGANTHVVIDRIGYFL